MASPGTIFLDEVGEIPLDLQPKLLRVLQEREFERLGSSRTLRTDARLIAAINRDLGAMVETQTFRSDLYYRLNVFPIRVPALRERPEDIPFLVRHFAQHFARNMKKQIDTISSETMNALVRYPWPGNIREMQNVIERAVILSRGPVLHIPSVDLKSRITETGDTNGFATLEEVERKHILSVLEQSNWSLCGPERCRSATGAQKTYTPISYAKARHHSATAFNSCENPCTIDVVPTDWRSANASASLVFPRNFIPITCPICGKTD